jgi:hypothetical protein
MRSVWIPRIGPPQVLEVCEIPRPDPRAGEVRVRGSSVDFADRSTRRCIAGCLSGDSLIETVDGPLAIASLAGKPMPVLTRLPGHRTGFRLMTKIACVATGVPVVRVTFDNDQAVTVDHGHVFYAHGTVERPVASLLIGELLDTSFHFPAGYEFRRVDGSTEISAGGLRVHAIAAAGTADVFTGIVHETGCFFATAGVLCKA